jgi:archaellum component FlaF (FlaF/FlaG flagellin family)
MNKITTPIAVLISGILIFIGLLILSNSLKDEYYYHVDSASTNEQWLIRTHKNTGISCYISAGVTGVFQKKPDHRDNKWACADN